VIVWQNGELVEKPAWPPQPLAGMPPNKAVKEGRAGLREGLAPKSPARSTPVLVFANLWT
jgi:hypothetical protein